MRLTSRQDPKDLRCDAKVGPASDLGSGSTRKIRIASLVISRGVEHAGTDEYFCAC